ncbi:IkappaB kinase complex, IKAP component [Rickenella mellea]|uniref:Elongator complex protein 1 n=1 Tax=Rickenella mellea TaxID=50990 RepID=A0A4Y7PNE7_9AGAM|nr:IkappaB kinase complex, IKAP component [Rickenella mellea]
MRNLVIASNRIWSLPNGHIATATVDVEHNHLYLLSENQNADGDVEIEVFKVENHDMQQKSEPISVGAIMTPASQTSALSQIISTRFLGESQSLAVITRAGDVGLLPLDNGDFGTFDVIGSIDVGIKSACWCPDDSIVVIVTGENKLLLMTSSFDVLSETSLRASDHGEDQPVNMGWGSKETQFHGSLGKTAAQAPGTAVDAIGSSPDDDGIPRIGWRGDGAFFVVSSLDDGPARNRRVLRVYDRQGALQTTSQPVAGLEHTLCWRPSGNLIVSTQRFGYEGGEAGNEGRHDVVFFERNGLRHGEFRLRERWEFVKDAERRWGYRIREVGWNSDSTVLAIWIERDEGDVVQLWTTGNYHWYLKQEILPPTSVEPRRFSSLNWHPESSMQLFLTCPACVLDITFTWETYASRSPPPNDTGLIAVVDGSDLLLTPFRTQNVPPPMYSCKISLAHVSNSQTSLIDGRAPVHVALSPSDDALCVLRHSGRLEIWDVQGPMDSRKPNAFSPVKICEGSVNFDQWQYTAEQLGLWPLDTSKTSYRIACLFSSTITDTVIISDFIDGVESEMRRVDMASNCGRLVASDREVFWQSDRGQIFHVYPSKANNEPIACFPQFCLTAEATTCNENDVIFIGLADAGNLCVLSSEGTTHQTVSTNANGFTAASGFLIFTTTSHEAHFAKLDVLHDLLSAQPDDKQTHEWEKRRVERGSRIVTAVPSAMSLVLQMPRGNLETINPRPLVLDVVRKDLDEGNFRKAFLACRKHRVEFNIMVEHDQNTFINRIPLFVQQVDDVDHLNLFLASLGQSSLDTDILTVVCDGIREQVQTRNLKKYMNSVLTAYVVKRPPDYEAALSLLLRLRDEEPELVEDAVKYIIFLVDADKLFDMALGMYDFSLVLMIAQHAQRDPREYLPFLRELRSLEKYYQRFKIDEHLKRHESALKNLHLAGAEYFDEAMVYTETHRLHFYALRLWKEDHENLKRVLDLYGEWLFDRREFRQAALAFVDAHNLPKAMVAYERALLWRELFDLALRTSVDADTLSEMAYRVADELCSKRKYSDAAQVSLDYAKDVNQAIATLAQGNLYSEARRLITLRDAPDLLVSTLHPAAFDTSAQILEDMTEIRTQLRKQFQRIRELRIKKEEEPDAFYGIDDPALHNVDVMTDASMPATAFTRYTVAPTANSRSSKRTSRSKRKMERKVGSGRKGTVDEEEYILSSITKLSARFDAVQGDAECLLPHLMQFSKEHRAEGSKLQDEVMALKKELSEAVDQIWAKPDDPDGALMTDTWAHRMEEKMKERRNPIEIVPKPALSSGEPRIDLLEL